MYEVHGLQNKLIQKKYEEAQIKKIQIEFESQKARNEKL